MNNPTRADRIAQLSEALALVADARTMSTTTMWAQAWDLYERELIERMLKCEAADDINRYRLQIAIEAARHARRAIEHATKTESGLTNELDVLEGRKKNPIEIVR
jgi:hypothetical protein